MEKASILRACGKQQNRVMLLVLSDQCTDKHTAGHVVSSFKATVKIYVEKWVKMMVKCGYHRSSNTTMVKLKKESKGHSKEDSVKQVIFMNMKHTLNKTL